MTSERWRVSRQICKQKRIDRLPYMTERNLRITSGCLWLNYDRYIKKQAKFKMRQLLISGKNKVEQEKR